LNNAGVIYRERNELERASECYLQAINIRPSFPQVRRALRRAVLCGVAAVQVAQMRQEQPPVVLAS